MACHLVGANPSSEPMMEYCYLDNWEQTSVKSQSKFIEFKKMHLILSSGKWQPSCLGLNLLTQKWCPGTQGRLHLGHSNQAPKLLLVKNGLQAPLFQRSPLIWLVGWLNRLSTKCNSHRPTRALHLVWLSRLVSYIPHQLTHWQLAYMWVWPSLVQTKASLTITPTNGDLFHWIKGK